MAGKGDDYRTRQDMPSKYDFISEVKNDKFYGAKDIKARDLKVRQKFEKEIPMYKRKDYVQGNMIMFWYLQPKLAEELEYFDAWPFTILLGEVTTKSGEKRIIGWNIHYYPPYIRYKILAFILEKFKADYKKGWNEGLLKPWTNFQYERFKREMRKAKLDFGIREYDPHLMTKIRLIPPKLWTKAVFTEGLFRKKSREAILKYWQSLPIK